MQDNTEFTPKPDKGADSSRIFNVSLRGWITLLVTSTVCVMSVYDVPVKEPMYTLVGMVVGYYFAQNKNTNDGHRQPKP